MVVGSMPGTVNFQAKLAESMVRVGAVFSTSLGPFGFKKAILNANNEIAFVKDGLSIASALPGRGVAEKVALEIAKAMTDTCGDGASSAIVLAARLMGNAKELLADGLHPNTVSKGYRMAINECISCLDRISRAVVADRKTVMALARTSLGTKFCEREASQLAGLVAEAALRSGCDGAVLRSLDVRSINVVGLCTALGKRIELIDGVFLDKNPAVVGMPRHLDSARVAIVDSLELGDSAYDRTMVLSKPDSLGKMVVEETKLLDAFVAKLEGLQVKFIACKGGIDDQVERKLAHDGILAVKSLREEEIRMVEGATGGRLALFSDLAQSDVGMAKHIEWRGEAEAGIEICCRGKNSSSIALRMGNRAFLDANVGSIKASIRLIACFLGDGRIVAGGGAAEAELRAAVLKKGRSVRGREGMAMDSFAEALLATSYALTQSAGLDPLDTVSRLVAAHKAGDCGACLELSHGSTEDAFKAGLIEPLALKRQAIISAGEAAQALLKCDEALVSVKTRA
jgi:chaperonin GroEL (HSP60 family)